MANVTAADVNKLRKMTGAGMMDCKKALVEAEGDLEMAIDVLRKQGQKVAAKRADRQAGEGAVLAACNADNTRGTIISLNCETDFVAKNDSFVAIASDILKVAVDHSPASHADLLALPFDAVMSVNEKLIEQTGVIGEKLEISFFEMVEAPFVAFYIHAGNKLATLIGLNHTAEEAGRNIAMQAAAMSPLALKRDEVSQEAIDRELEVGKDLARQEGKPEEMLERIAQGRLNKFFKESTLEEQEYIKDSKMSVGQYLKSVNKDLGLTAFKRVALQS